MSSRSWSLSKTGLSTVGLIDDAYHRNTTPMMHLPDLNLAGMIDNGFGR